MNDEIKNTTLNDISNEYAELEYLLTNFGEVSEEDNERIEQYLGELGEKRDAKIDAYCSVIRDFERRGAAQKAEAKRIGDLGNTNLNKAKSLKWMLLQFFIANNLDRIDTDRNRVVRAVNGTAPVEIGERFLENPEKLPKRFRLTIYKPNLKEIAAALKDGENLKFASFGEKGNNIRIA